MKKTLLLFILAVSAQLYSQKSLLLTSENNLILPGDSIYKYQVEYKDPGSLGQKLEWDFTHLNILDDSYLIKYFHPDSADLAQLCGMEHRTRYYYRQDNDSLWSTGFENYNTFMDYSQPELKMKFPFAYGDTLFSNFTGMGKYSNLHKLQVEGYTEVVADATGYLKTPYFKGRSLRVHTKRFYTQVKSENPFVSDVDDMIDISEQSDTLQMTLDTYSWYIRDVRYPVFESVKTTLHFQGEEQMDTTLFYTSFYYSPEELPETIEDTEEPEIEKIFTEASFAPNPVESNLNINYKLTQSAAVSFRLLSSLGQPLYQTAPYMQDEGNHYLQIPMSNLIKGNYTLYIYVDDMMMNRVVVKK